MNINDVVMLRVKLVAELQKLDNQGFIIPGNEVNDPIDVARSYSDRETALLVFEQQIHKRVAILIAIDHIDTGAFKGVCEKCHQEISWKRLQAVPWAEYCTSCQGILEELENEYKKKVSKQEPVLELDPHFV